MNARQIEVFRTIMRLGTLTGAAQALNVSQPALSQLLLHAEDRLGYKLFRRLRGRLVPTPEAQLLFPEAERLHRDIEGFRRFAEGLREGEGGSVRLAASAPPSLSFLPQALMAFRAGLPGVHLSAFVVPHQIAMDMLGRGDADLGVTLSDKATPLVQAETIGQAELVCLLPSRHRLARRKALGPEDLVEETLISYRKDSLPGQLLDQEFARAGIPFRPQVEIDVSIIALSFVQQGIGVAVVDGLIPWLAHPGLVVRPFRPLVRLPIAVLCGTRRPLSLQQERLRAGLRDAFGAYAADPVSRGLLTPA
ncbi:LysR family transcriptional regulator [Falsiroseomonas stagni]|uniref:DNA-binding transcriptional regulator, LysR family n=1 Tax=Falsiroseomonas stagni DSM 19981 TaxID=1123062 RepID=A0A1I4EU20_9PROT|nr:LysR family transcriptional regulator [Falsiroseomonas stagni]SFL09212.1 DNA-binding transcriptional regulator, LysR family [Falsiroseomonas stagni DSM 19981]